MYNVNPRKLLKMLKLLETAKYIIPIVVAAIIITGGKPGGDPIDDPEEF